VKGERQTRRRERGTNLHADERDVPVGQTSSAAFATPLSSAVRPTSSRSSSAPSSRCGSSERAAVQLRHVAPAAGRGPAGEKGRLEKGCRRGPTPPATEGRVQGGRLTLRRKAAARDAKWPDPETPARRARNTGAHVLRRRRSRCSSAKWVTAGIPARQPPALKNRSPETPTALEVARQTSKYWSYLSNPGERSGEEGPALDRRRQRLTLEEGPLPRTAGQRPAHSRRSRTCTGTFRLRRTPTVLIAAQKAYEADEFLVRRRGGAGAAWSSRRTTWARTNKVDQWCTEARATVSRLGFRFGGGARSC